MEDRASKTCSKELNVFKMAAEALGALSLSRILKLSMMSFSFVVLMKLGRSLGRIVLINLCILRTKILREKYSSYRINTIL